MASVYAATMLAGPCALAQTYPSRPVRLIVPFAPGGGSDIIARVLAPHLSELLAQQVLIDNRPGAGTIIGAELAAKSPPDGYTLFLGITGTMAINPSMYRKLPYDPVRDFAAIGLVGTGPNVLVVHPSLPARSIPQLISIAKNYPGKLSYASAGTGGAPHLAGELFKSMAGIDMVHIPYKGAAPATTDLLAGEVQVMFAGLGAALPFVKTSRLRALGVAGAKRTRALPGTRDRGVSQRLRSCDVVCAIRPRRYTTANHYAAQCRRQQGDDAAACRTAACVAGIRAADEHPRRAERLC